MLKIIDFRVDPTDASATLGQTPLAVNDTSRLDQ